MEFLLSTNGFLDTGGGMPGFLAMPGAAGFRSCCVGGVTGELSCVGVKLSSEGLEGGVVLEGFLCSLDSGVGTFSGVLSSELS